MQLLQIKALLEPLVDKKQAAVAELLPLVEAGYPLGTEGRSPYRDRDEYMSVAFLDTNVLVYAFDRLAGSGHDAAEALFQRITRDGNAVVSVQVLQEWVNTLTRKVREPLALGDVRYWLQVFLNSNWQTVTPGASDLLVVVDIMERWQLSWWDALIVAMAQAARAHILWTEDLNTEQNFGELTVRNPFRE
jgi:predicted nucleic acid-binding protein